MPLPKGTELVYEAGIWEFESPQGFLTVARHQVGSVSVVVAVGCTPLSRVEVAGSNPAH
jgi:hypothetical protein